MIEEVTAYLRGHFSKNRPLKWTFNDRFIPCSQKIMPIGRVPLGKKVRGLREGKGWTQEDLVRLAEIDKKTVSRMENSKPSMVTHISYVATALGVDCSELLEPEECEAKVSPNSKGRSVTLKLTCEVLIEDLEEAIKYYQLLMQQFSVNHACNLLDIDAGSIVALIEMEFSDAVQLIYDFCLGRFDSFRLMEIELLDFTPDELQIARLVVSFYITYEVAEGMVADPTEASAKLEMPVRNYLDALLFWNSKERDDAIKAILKREGMIKKLESAVLTILERLLFWHTKKSGYFTLFPPLPISFPNTVVKISPEGTIRIARPQQAVATNVDKTY